VSFAAITLRVTSQLVFIIVNVYFVIDSIRKLLDTPSFVCVCVCVCVRARVRACKGMDVALTSLLFGNFECEALDDDRVALAL
jgi:hypothetical protein